MIVMRYWLLALAIGLLLLAACTRPEATLAPTSTSTLVATLTPTPSLTPLPTPTMTPAATGADARAELHNVQAAVNALMADNGLTRIPNPVDANVAPCTVGTKNMHAFPDVTSNASNGGKMEDPGGKSYTFPGDEPGYVLFDHDIHADGTQYGLVNYIVWATTVYCYTVNELSTVFQVPDTGQALKPPSPALTAGLVVGPTAAAATAIPPTPTPTPTATSPLPTLTPTGTMDTSRLSFMIAVLPSEPSVGDAIRVTAYGSGPGGLPQYRLRIEPSGILSFESPDTVSVSQLGVQVSFDLRAVQAGEAMLQVWVNYEKEFCSGSLCVYQFTNAYADPIRVSVRDRLP